jgi:hypothetical protein
MYNTEESHVWRYWSVRFCLIECFNHNSLIKVCDSQI